MKVAWRRKTGDVDSSELPGRVLRGAMMASSSMLKEKLARLRASIVGIRGSFWRSFTIRQGIFFNGLILKMPVLPSSEPSSTTWPATHGKFTHSRSRPLVKVSMIAGCEEASVTEKQQHI